MYLVWTIYWSPFFRKNQQWKIYTALAEGFTPTNSGPHMHRLELYFTDYVVSEFAYLG